MYKIYRFIYVDRKVKIKWEIFARNATFADRLASRITGLPTGHSLQRAKRKFATLVVTEWPPYELEQAQTEYVEDLEKKALEAKK